MNESNFRMLMLQRHGRVLCTGLIFSGLACADLSAPLPSGVINPGSVQTAAGAHGMYVATHVQFQYAFAQYIVASGLMTDELQAIARGQSVCMNCDNTGSDRGAIVLDARYDAQDVGQIQTVYTALHGIRTLAAQAIGALAAYDATNSAARRAELYAMQGYAEIWLADFYCSGVPLSTYDFGKDYQYRPGVSTDNVYRHATALFDTAITLGADSVVIRSLASVGKGRAWLALGEYDSAGVAVRDIPADFAYVHHISACDRIGDVCESPSNGNIRTQAMFPLIEAASVGNMEGGSGYPFISSNDPRTRSYELSVPDFPVRYFPVYFPEKYVFGGISTLTVSSFIEAQLIKAESFFHQDNGSAMVNILNNLRSSLSIAAIPDDSITNAAAQEQMLFSERAAWLFLSGHRQGDLRRRVRRYKRAKDAIYPHGTYPAIGVYGPNIDVAIPRSELANPYFRGCSRD